MNRNKNFVKFVCLIWSVSYIFFISSCKEEKVVEKVLTLKNWKKNLELIYINDQISKNDYVLTKYYILKRNPEEVLGNSSFLELRRDAKGYVMKKFRMNRYPMFLPDSLLTNIINDSDNGFFGSNALSFRVEVENSSLENLPLSEMQVRFFSPLGRLFSIGIYDLDTIIGGNSHLEFSKQYGLDELNKFLVQDNYQFWNFEDSSLIYSSIVLDCQFN